MSPPPSPASPASGPERRFAPPALPAGDGPLLFGRYALQRELGRGGMGRVLLAFDSKLRIQVALKLVPDQLLADEAATEDLRREVLRGIALAHPAIVRTHTFEQDETGAAIVMEYVDGITFAQLKEQQPSRCFDPAELLPWLPPLCQALDYAHQQARIVHRDLKPRNIMTTSHGQLKVADFGLAATLTESISGDRMADRISGTPLYMSPQQVRGLKPSHLDDVYSLGATLYDLIAGSPPFFRGGMSSILMQVTSEPPQTMTERRTELGIDGKAPIPAHWEETIAACLAKEPAERPRSCGEVLARLHGQAGSISASWRLVSAAPEAAAAETRSYDRVMAGARFAGLKVFALALAALGLGVLVFTSIGRKNVPIAPTVATQPARAVPSPVEPPKGTPAAAMKEAPLVKALESPPPPDRTSGPAAPAAAPAKEPALLAKPATATSTPAPSTPKPLNATEKWLVELDGMYEPRWQSEVVEPYESSLAALKQAMLSGLDLQIAAASRSAKLDEAVAYRNERLQVEKGRGPAPHDDDSPPPTLRTLRATWRAQAAQIATDQQTRAQRLFAQFDKILADNEALLTQRQRLDEALLLRHRREALKDEWLSPPPEPGTPAAATRERPFVNSLEMKFVPVAIIGGPTGKQRVLFSIWETRVQDYEPFALNMKRAWAPPASDFQQGPTHPAILVSWFDAVAFCGWLTAHERAAGLLPAQLAYRLPTDHEWSCAAGIGEREDPLPLPQAKHLRLRDVYPWGTQWPPPPRTGNFAGEEIRSEFEARSSAHFGGYLAEYRDDFARTAPVGSFPAERFGLFDICGNVAEWCEDWFDAQQKDRVLRGSLWSSSDRGYANASNRIHAPPAAKYVYYGFRCVLAPVEANQQIPSTAPATPALPPAPAQSAKATPVPPIATPAPKLTPTPAAKAPAPGAISLAPGISATTFPYYKSIQALEWEGSAVQAQFRGELRLQEKVLGPVKGAVRGLAFHPSGRIAVAEGSGTAPQMGLHYWTSTGALSPLLKLTFRSDSSVAEEAKGLFSGFSGRLAFAPAGACYFVKGIGPDAIYRVLSTSPISIEKWRPGRGVFQSLQIPFFDTTSIYATTQNQIYKLVSDKADSWQQGTPRVWFRLAGSGVLLNETLAVSPTRLLLGLYFLPNLTAEPPNPTAVSQILMLDRETGACWSIAGASAGPMAISGDGQRVIRFDPGTRTIREFSLPPAAAPRGP